MATNTIKSRLVVCTKTATQWESYSIIPLKGEFCVESDTNKIKIGDGTNTYANLPYFGTYVNSGDTWISISTADGVVTLTHAAPQAADATKSITENSSAADVMTGISIDTKGHVRTMPDTKTIVGADKITVTSDGSNITIDHDNTTRVDSTVNTNIASDNDVVTNIATDATGHITSVTKDTTILSKVITGANTVAANKIVLGNNGARDVKDSNVEITTDLNTNKNSDAFVPTTKAVADYIGNFAGAMRFMGSIGEAPADVQVLPASHKVGDTYIVATAGTYAGVACEIGDMIICKKDGSVAANADWTVVNGENQVEVQNTTMNFGGERNIGNVDGVQLKVTMPTITNPDFTESTIETVASISQDTTNGSVSVTKQNIRTATTSVSGITTLTDTVNTGDSTKAVDGKAVGDFVASEIGKLDVTENKARVEHQDGINGFSISGVKETDGKIVDGGNGVVKFTGGTQQFTMTVIDTFDDPSESSENNYTISVNHGNHTGDVTSNGLVTTIANSAVTTAKIADGNVTTAKLADNAVTFGKMQVMTERTILGNNTDDLHTPIDLTTTEINAMLGTTTAIVDSMKADGITSASKSATPGAGLKGRDGYYHKISTFALEDDASGNTLIIDGNF